MGWCEVIPGTITSTSAQLRTFVYEVYNLQYISLGWKPTSPGSVTFAYTKLEIPSTISVNSTWDGNFVFDNSITINSGVTLTVTPGSVLSFTSGASLIVNGTLNASGTLSSPITFNFISPTTQNGIQFNSGSSGSTISYCKILNAYRGIYENGVSVNILNSALSSCTYGIYLYNSSPTIQINNIHNNSYGIYLTSSSPYLYNNYIQNNSQYGVYCTTNSNPKFGNGSAQGKNNITGNPYGLFCWNNSLPMLGKNSPLDGGYNNLVNTNYNVYNMSSNGIYANNNWWGSTTPSNFKISSGSGNVTWSPYRTSPATISPRPTLSKTNGNSIAEGSNDIPLLSDLQKAMELIATNNLPEARNICLNLITNYPDYAVSYNALNLLKDTYSANEISSSKDNYKSLFNTKGKKNLYAMAGLVLADIDKGNKLSLIDNVINDYKNESVVELALFDKFVCYYFEKADTANALVVSKELDQIFPQSQGAVEAHRILGDKGYDNINENQGQPLQKTTVETPNGYALLGNYPNPFNPSTNISYQLPEAARVTLKVYDMLGREVAKLVDSEMETGRYSVAFNGSGLSSGIYFVRFIVTPQNGNQPITKTMKMLLAK
jgi:parallel beta-helix repeat protein